MLARGCVFALVTATCISAVLGGISVPDERGVDFVNSGTPPGVPAEFDCAIREYAWGFGKDLLKWRGDFSTLYDALQLHACGTPPPETADDHWAPRGKLEHSVGKRTLYVCAQRGSDDFDGSETQPFKTIRRALQAVEGEREGRTALRGEVKPVEILLRAGRYEVQEPILITPSHNQVTIRAYPGEEVVISGGEQITIPRQAWLPWRVERGTWETAHNKNNVFAIVKPGKSTNTVEYLGEAGSLDECTRMADEWSSRNSKTVHSVTWHSHLVTKDYADMCYATTTDTWGAVSQLGVHSSRRIVTNTWVASIKDSHPDITSITGMRTSDGARAVRARYPNLNPELSGQYFETRDASFGEGKYREGWVTAPTKWIPPREKPRATDVRVNAKDWPGVDWPMTDPAGGSVLWSGMGDWGDFHIGIGGTCDDVDPPAGYFCANTPPRDPTGSFIHRSPSGLIYSDNILPNSNRYTDLAGAVVHAWRGGGRWYTNQYIVESHDPSTHKITFDPKSGFQGGEGSSTANEFYIENVKEECDSPGEFYFDETTRELYFSFNGTAMPSDETFIVTRSKVLFNVKGTKDAPVEDFALEDIVIRDTAFTGLDPHSLPSAGDWAVTRSAAVVFEDTRNCSVRGCLFTRVDGNAMMLSRYNKNTRIVENEFSWVGDTAIVLWGDTSPCLNADCTLKAPGNIGPDGRGGDHPKQTLAERNLVREVGVFQKQSSMWFQAIATETTLSNNVHFNGPRAGINFNDGMGGGDRLVGNLLLNCVRESGDHGPINTWNRMPYITEVGFHKGKASTRPAWREITKNLIMATYASQEAVDNDDGSSYYHTHKNVFIYGSNGLKSDFGGHHNLHHGNVYAFAESCLSKVAFGYYDEFIHNTCVLRTDSGGYDSDCSVSQGMKVQENNILTQSGELQACGEALSDWVAGGHDNGTTVAKWPSRAALLKQFTEVLTEQ